KDAIDQVQVAYRKFDDSQRLGIVDTDYMMFSALDVGPDPVIVSKLNKTNISANYLRPLLLSSKIMIVSALTRYPQSDMGTLYNAIKESKHRKVIASGAKNRAQTEKKSEWLWNEDTVDMNSTARHCEAIMYDYFDYYEKYELSYKSLSNIKKYYKSLLAPEKKEGQKSIYLENGELDFAALMADGPLGEFKRVVLDLTRQNVDKVKVVYTENLQEKDKEYQKLLRAKEDSEKDYEQRIADLKKANERELSKERKRHETELQKLKISIDIGNTVRGWIKEEADRNLRDMLSYMILNNINGRQDADDFSVGNMMRGRNNDEIADGKFKGVSELSKGIMAEYRDDTDAAEKLYGDKFRDALGMQSLLEYALDDLLKNNNVRDAVRSVAPLEEKNVAISAWYNKWKSKRQTGVYNIEEEQEQSDDDDNESNDD
ncbi:MAG: hypothetical protein K2M48_06915, partial [Clostridiales bacterium]|nr:hypothetical protein [Clostridiales bacterium]